MKKKTLCKAAYVIFFYLKKLSPSIKKRKKIIIDELEKLFKI